MALGSKEYAVEKLDGMDHTKLLEALKDAKAELFNLRFQTATGQAENSSRLKAVKRDIARIYTILRERELGIREDVVVPVEETKEDKKAAKKAAKKGDA